MTDGTDNGIWFLRNKTLPRKPVQSLAAMLSLTTSASSTTVGIAEVVVLSV